MQLAITIEPWCCYASWSFDCDIYYSECYFGRDLDHSNSALNGCLYLGNRIDINRYSELHIYQVLPEGGQLSLPEDGFYSWNYLDWGDDYSFGNVFTTCGNNQIEGEEECDDGNLSNNDGCSTECMVEGDVVDDGSLNVADIVLIVGMIIGNEELDLLADVDGNGTVNVSDIVLIVCWITNCS